MSVPLRALAAMGMYQEYGLYHAVLAPLLLGRSSLLLHSGFSVELTWSVLSMFGVTNFAAGPTVYRALRDATPPDLSGLALRHCSAAGEPLPPDVVEWAQNTLGVPVLDHYGQTELGMVAGTGWHPDVHDTPPWLAGLLVVVAVG